MESSQVVNSDAKALETKFAATIDSCRRIGTTIGTMKQWSVSFAEIKKKGAKVQSFCVAAGAKDKCNELGLKIAEVCREFGVSATQLPAKLNELRAEAVALKEQIEAAKAPPPVPMRHNGRRDRPPRRFIRDRPPAQTTSKAPEETGKDQNEGIKMYSRWAETFKVLAGMVAPGKESVSPERRIVRSEDGNLIATYWTTGRQEAMKRTFTEQADTTTTVIDVRYSAAGSMIELVPEKETTIAFKETAFNKGSFIGPRMLPPATEERRGTLDWITVVDKRVRVNLDTLTFTIGQNSYEINEHRAIPIATGQAIAHCIQDGHIVSPFLEEIGSKLAYLQRNPANTFTAVMELHLPYLVANVDFFTPDETPYAPPTRSGRSPEAQRLREQAIAQA